MDFHPAFKDLSKKALRLGILFVICSAVLVLTCVIFFNDDLNALPPEAKADRIVIEKAAHRLTLYSNGAVLRSYPVSIGRGGLEAKTQEGDKLTPEGEYRITGHLHKSSYHLALRVNYPNAEDLKRASKKGVYPGSDIMIHGIRNRLGWIGTLHRQVDWTLGCVAVTNAEIEEISRVVPDGTPVEIKK
jgi:murein L,D-transpeptidase YafK